MKIKSSILKAALISLIIWVTTDALFLLTVALVMMITEQTFASYVLYILTDIFYELMYYNPL